MVPTMHFNYRYFECIASNGKRTWWYGGGTDLTPYFLIDGDVEHFHNTLKRGCDQYDLGYYPRFKKWCDEYFYIKHRKETRGVGGIFFDDLDNKPQEELFQYVRNMAATVLPAYLPLVEARKDAPYTESDREWQLLRRGRYVEFNLVYDRGTKFGLVTPQVSRHFLQPHCVCSLLQLSLTTCVPLDDYSHRLESSQSLFHCH